MNTSDLSMKGMVIMMKKKRKGLIIAGSIILVIILIIILIPKILFTDYKGLPTTGDYEVKMASAITIDESRLESFETDGSNREVPVYFYYPDTKDTEKNSFPLVVFSHGAFGYYQSNVSTYMELASNGYVVVSLDHPYHSFFTTDTEGKTITVNPEFLQQALNINNESVSEKEVIQTSHTWLDIRVADINFVLDSVKEAKKAQSLNDKTWYVSDDETKTEIFDILSMVNIEKIGMMGHSLGGASSVTIGRTRNDISAVIDIDGTMLGEEFDYENGVYKFYEGNYPVPLLSFNSQSHQESSDEANLLYVNNVVLENAVDGQYTYFEGSEHMNFTDLPLFSPILASFLGVGEVDATECITTMNEVILDYFNCYLKDQGEVVIKECY